MAKKPAAYQEKVLEAIHDISSGVYKDILKRSLPELSMPLRALNNVKYDEKEGYSHPWHRPSGEIDS